MKRINLIKYGFVRWPEADFSDDGNHFVCYRAGKQVEVSKLVSNGEAYLSASSSVGRGTLPYDVYSKLPHYHDSNWKWNGVSVDSLTDQDLEDFYNACILYEQEYEAAEAALVYPTLEELTERTQQLQALRLQELNEATKEMTENIMAAATKLSKYNWARIQEYITCLVQEAARYDPVTYPQTIYKTMESFDFVKPDSHKLTSSCWYNSLLEIIHQATV